MVIRPSEAERHPQILFEHSAFLVDAVESSCGAAQSAHQGISRRRRICARLRCAETRDYDASTEDVEGHFQIGNINLDLAIQAAQQAAPGADRLINWTLKGVSGRQGGITGLKECTVVINARVS